MTINSSTSLWVITAYFNPLGSTRRRANFKTFRRHLGARLLAVELSPDGHFDLADEDADRLLRVRGGDVLWQKERLLNLALRALPDGCDGVAWLDADVVFIEPDWQQRVVEALRRYRLIQVFDRLLDLGPHERIEDVAGNGNRSPSRVSVTSGLEAGRFDLGVFGRSGGSLGTGYTPGHAWAARRSLLRETDFCDALILGSGDKAMAAAAYDQVEPLISSLDLTPAHADHLRAWAKPLSRAVAGSIGFCRNTLLHLWHGELARRQYQTRYLDFRRFDFDPSVDLELTESGAWQWNSEKPDMHRYVRQYFVSRCEDGPPARQRPKVTP